MQMYTAIVLEGSNKVRLIYLGWCESCPLKCGADQTTPPRPPEKVGLYRFVIIYHMIWGPAAFLTNYALCRIFCVHQAKNTNSTIKCWMTGISLWNLFFFLFLSLMQYTVSNPPKISKQYAHFNRIHSYFDIICAIISMETCSACKSSLCFDSSLSINVWDIWPFPGFKICGTLAFKVLPEKLLRTVDFRRVVFVRHHSEVNQLWLQWPQRQSAHSWQGWQISDAHDKGHANSDFGYWQGRAEPLRWNFSGTRCINHAVF